MKKLITLTTLLLCAVVSSWAAATWTVDYSSKPKNWAPTENTETINVDGYGTVTLTYAVGDKTDVFGSAQFMKFSGNAVVLTITLPAGKTFKAGDKIQVTGKGGKSSSVGCVYIADGAMKGPQIAAKSQSNFDSGEIEIPEDFVETNSMTFRRATSSELAPDGETTCGGTFYLQKVIYTEATKTISSEAFSGVKVDGSTLTENEETNGYTISDNTITLSNDIVSLLAPTNVTLTNHITYSDESTKDNNVNVSFNGTIDAGYFIGSATIGTTDYTVRVKQDVTPTVTATPNAVSVTSAGTERTISFTITGVNLTNGTYDTPQPSVSGLSITPVTFTVAEKALNQEFTVHYTASGVVAQANAIATFDVNGATTNVTVTYKGVETHSQRTVSEMETWDWSEATGSDVNLTNATTPAKDSEGDIVATDFDGEVYEYNCGFPSNFDAIVMNKFQRPKNGSYYQGQTLKLKTSVPGIITVVWANTGNKRPNRYLSVNGTIYGEGSGDEGSASKRTTSVSVPAGTITLTGIYEPNKSNYSATEGYQDYVDANASTAQYLNYYSVKFTPTVEIPVSAAGYATFYSDKALDFTGIKDITAYTATKAGNIVTFNKVTDAVPAGTGLLVKGVTTDVPVAASAGVVSNIMVGTLTETTIAAGNFVLLNQDDVIGFYRTTASFTARANSAWLPASVAGARVNFIGFDEEGGELTGIQEVSTVSAKAEQLYNLRGQRVAQPSKGLYIVNGKKVILK